MSNSIFATMDLTAAERAEVEARHRKMFGCTKDEIHAALADLGNSKNAFISAAMSMLSDSQEQLALAYEGGGISKYSEEARQTINRAKYVLSLAKDAS